MQKAIHSPGHRRLCLFLRERRLQLDLRQSDVARELGVPQSFVSSYENGHRRLDLAELDQICKVLRISLEKAVATFASTTD